MIVHIADDDAVTRKILAAQVRAWGYEPEESENGEQAWRRLQSADGPRLAILDWEMPGLDGVDICRRLMERREAPLVYTILLTVRNRPADMAAALESGAHTFVSKPVEAPVLHSLLQVGARLVEMEDELKRYATQMEELAEERARQLVRAEYMAQTDDLTGVLNRRGLLDVLCGEFHRARRYFRPLSVLTFDLDGLKEINDRHGHDAGDVLLVAVARTCRRRLRDGDAVGRLGGDEFAVILPETGMSTAEQVAERLRTAVAEIELYHSGTRLTTSLSMGLAQMSSHDTGADGLLKRADNAMYDAKRGGRDRVEASSGIPRPVAVAALDRIPNAS